MKRLIYISNSVDLAHKPYDIAVGGMIVINPFAASFDLDELDVAHIVQEYDGVITTSETVIDLFYGITNVYAYHSKDIFHIHCDDNDITQMLEARIC